MRLIKLLALFVLLALLAVAGLPGVAAEPPASGPVDLAEPGQAPADPAVQPAVPPVQADPTLVDRTLRSAPEADAPEADTPAPAAGIAGAIPVAGEMRVLDTFTRVDGPLGDRWTVGSGNCTITGSAATCDNRGMATINDPLGGGNAAEADVQAVGTSLQYAALLLNYGAGVNNVFIKVQQQDGGGKFNYLGCRTGNNGGTFGLGLHVLDSPFASAHMKVTRYGNQVTIRFSNIDGGTQADQEYICSGAPNPEGTGIGIAGYYGASRIDNFAIPTLWDNGALATNVSGGVGGAAVSVLQTSLGLSVLGVSAQRTITASVADDFTITERQGWHISRITLYEYQSGTYPNPPTNTITAAYFRIWNGPPDLVTSTVVYGDLETNRLLMSYWSGMYRVAETSLLAATRPVMTLLLDADINLPPGQYWLEFAMQGTDSMSGPWVPPITMLGQTSTGDAIYYFNGAWEALLDGSYPTGVPFILEGSVLQQTAIPLVLKQ
ncbi:MAG: hypothetical protein ACYC6L_11405 [Anaerolineae bacterium]